MRKRCLARNAAALLLAISVMTACSSSVREEGIAEPIPDYSHITAVESSSSGFSDAFSITDGSLYRIGSRIEYITDMQMSSGGDTIAQLVRLSRGKNLEKNVIKIYRGEKMMTLDSFFSASDINMNASGTRLAYRSYSQDSLDSVQKLKIFDTAARKTEEIKSGVRVSGSIYCWIDDENLLYYGTDQKTGGEGKIYKYNAATGTEEVYLEGLKGFCMYMMPAEGGIVFFLSTGTEASLCFSNGKGGIKTITPEIAELYKAEYNAAEQEIYMAGVREGEAEGALYKISLNGAEGLKRVNYDFPKVVGADSTLTADSGGHLYFTGMLEGKSAAELDIFSYDYTSGAVSLLSSESGFYRLY